MNDNKQIMFVDDDVNILQGLKRALRPLRKNWDMIFIENGINALELIKQQKFDVVVIDHKMPDISGIELLKEIIKIDPMIIRIVLSGVSDKDIPVKAISSYSHQFLSKPCNIQHLISIIERLNSLFDMINNPSIRRIISKVKSLPSTPTLYAEIENKLGQPDASIKEIGEIISKDIAMSAKVLQLVNSSYFSLIKNITTTEEAASFLGLDIIKALVISVQFYSEFDFSKFPPLFIEKISDHSLKTGFLAKKIAERLNYEKTTIDNSFFAGTMHDCGKLILAANFPKDYKEIINKVESENADFSELEIEAFGASHTEIGAYLLGIWGLPIPITEAIAFHHNPLLCKTEKFDCLTALYIGNILANEKEKSIDYVYLSNLNLVDEIEKFKSEFC